MQQRMQVADYFFFSFFLKTTANDRHHFLLGPRKCPTSESFEAAEE
jgi:hypothetical protein